jgi:NADH:ubiquinone oxidoreductase subunit
MSLFKQLFTWWNGQTVATRFFTWRKGEFVGSDEAGNRYYRAKSAVPQSIAERRWVIYNGVSEASAIPPGWHAWMHHRVDSVPGKSDSSAHPWQKPHLPNLTGTAAAYRPPGSLRSGEGPQRAPADYESWRPR